MSTSRVYVALDTLKDELQQLKKFISALEQIVLDSDLSSSSSREEEYQRVKDQLLLFLSRSKSNNRNFEDEENKQEESKEVSILFSNLPPATTPRGTMTLLTPSSPSLQSKSIDLFPPPGTPSQKIPACRSSTNEFNSSTFNPETSRLLLEAYVDLAEYRSLMSSWFFTPVLTWSFFVRMRRNGWTLPLSYFLMADAFAISFFQLFALAYKPYVTLFLGLMSCWIWIIFLTTLDTKILNYIIREFDFWYIFSNCFIFTIGVVVNDYRMDNGSILEVISTFFFNIILGLHFVCVDACVFLRPRTRRIGVMVCICCYFIYLVYALKRTEAGVYEPPIIPFISISSPSVLIKTSLFNYLLFLCKILYNEKKSKRIVLSHIFLNVNKIVKLRNDRPSASALVGGKAGGSEDGDGLGVGGGVDGSGGGSQRLDLVENRQSQMLSSSSLFPSVSSA